MEENRLLKLSKGLVALAAVCLSALPLAADYTKSGVPDSAEIRSEIVDSWLTAPLVELRSRKSEVRQDGVGGSFQISMEERTGEFVIAVAPERQQAGGGETAAPVYAKDAPGGWLLYRNSKTGRPTKIRWYFNADPDVYVEFRDGTPKTYADMVVFGSYAARSIPMGFTFKKLYGYSFDDIRQLTKNSLPWSKVTVEAGQYGSMLTMVERIRRLLPRITYGADACYNEDGELYSIEHNVPYAVPERGAVRTAVEEGRPVLSGAGLVKWVTDGLIHKGTVLTNMLAPTVNYNSLGKNGVLSQDTSLSFTLDWCRNLAVEVLNANSSKRRYSYTIGFEDVTGVDVREVPFVADLVDGALKQSAGYSIDTGYSPRELKGLMYILAVTEPRYLYFAAIKQHSPDRPGEAAFNNCAVLFPYFNDEGHFECAVFEMDRELTLDEFVKNHDATFIHLERVRSSDYFNPLQK